MGKRKGTVFVSSVVFKTNGTHECLWGWLVGIFVYSYFRLTVKGCEVPSMVNHQLGSQKSRWKLRKTAKEVILVLDNHGLDAELVLFFYLGMG